MMKIVLQFTFQFLLSTLLFSQSKSLLLPIKSNYKWGYCNQDGKVVIEPQFDFADNFVCKLAKIKVKGKYGILDSTGKLIIEPKEQAINIFCPDYISVKEDSLWGLDDSRGNKLIEPKYDQIQLWEGDLFQLSKNNLLGAFHASKMAILDPIYNSIKKSSSLFLLNKSGKFGLADKNLKVIFEPQYVGLEIIDSNIVLIKEKDFWAISYAYGVNITKFEYMAFKKVSDQILMVKAKVGGWHAFNLRSKKIITKDPHETYVMLNEDLILTTKANRHGVIDIDGNVVLAPLYNNIHLNDDYLLIEKDGKWGLTTLEGNTIIETIHDRVFPFRKNLAVFETSHGKGVINIKGKILINPSYTSIDIKDNLAYCTLSDGSTEILTLDGKAKKISVKNKPVVSQAKLQTAHSWLKSGTKKWGLVGNDTVYIPFKFDELIQKGNYALGGLKIDYRSNPRMYGFLNQQKLVDLATSRYDLIDNISGKVLHSGNNIWYCRIEDFQTGLFAKMIYEGGYQALISSQGKIIQEYAYQTKEKKLIRQPFVYVSKFNEQIASFNVGGTINFAGDWESDKVTNGKWGYISQDGKFLAEPQFDEAGPFVNGRAIVKTKGLYGVIDHTGNYVVKPIHASISFLENANNKFLKIETKKDRFGIINNQGKLVAPIAYDKIFPFKEGLARVMINGKYGFIDTEHKLVIPAVYDNALDFSEGRAGICSGKLWGFINKEGAKEIIPMSPFVGNYKNGIAPASKDGKMTYVNMDGRLLIVPKFIYASEFSNGLAIVSTDGKKKGLIDTQAKVVLDEQFDDIQFINNSKLLKVKEDGEWKLFSLTTQKIISKKTYLDIGEFYDGLSLAKTDKNYNYIDTTGKVIINRKLTFSFPFSNGLARAGLDTKTGFLDTKGNEAINFVLGPSLDFNSNRSFTQFNNKFWSIIDKNGKNITEPVFTNPKPYSDAFALVQQGKNWIFVDTMGVNVFNQSFEMAYSFDNGVARAKTSKWGLLSKDGYHLVDNQYDYISEFKDGQAVIGLNNSVGIADLNGNFIIEPVFDRVYGISETIFRTEQSDAIGYIKPDKTYVWDLNK